MLSCAQAVASDLVYWTIPPLEAEYGAPHGAPNIDSMEPLLRILPPPASTIAGVAGVTAEKGAVEVGVDDRAPLFEGQLLRALANVGTGVVDENVDAAATLPYRFSHGLDVVTIGYIANHGERLAAGFFDLGGDTLRLVLSAGGDGDGRSGPGQALPYTQSNATVAAGDDGDLTRQIE